MQNSANTSATEPPVVSPRPASSIYYVYVYAPLANAKGRVTASALDIGQCIIYGSSEEPEVVIEINGIFAEHRHAIGYFPELQVL